MKKIFVLFCLCLSACAFFTFLGGQAQKTETQQHKIYYVDRKLHRLIPTDFEASSNSSEKIAREIVKNIIKGKDYNNEILRIIPDTKDAVKVRIKKDTAYIDISGDIKNHITKNAETERLFVYQLVNSITSVPEIEFVKFTIDGDVQKDFLGFLDMREVFKANYDI